MAMLRIWCEHIIVVCEFYSNFCTSQYQGILDIMIEDIRAKLDLISIIGQGRR